MSKIFIPGNVPSLKNGKTIIQIGPRCKCCGYASRRIMIPNKSIEIWRKNTKRYWETYRKNFLTMLEGIEPPFRITFKFIRDSKRKFDYTNALDTVQDEMVAHHWIEDDNCTIIRPIILPYSYDKQRSGVYIGVKV